jgi:hypothetical protein
MSPLCASECWPGYPSLVLPLFVCMHSCVCVLCMLHLCKQTHMLAFICMYVCMYVRTFVRTHARTYVCMYVCIDLCMHVCCIYVSM